MLTHITTNTDWDSPEWLESAQTWINNNLLRIGLEPTGKLEKVSAWSLGYIFKQDTAQGYYFFKATAFLPLFSNEQMKDLEQAYLNAFNRLVNFSW